MLTSKGLRRERVLPGRLLILTHLHTTQAVHSGFQRGVVDWSRPYWQRVGACYTNGTALERRRTHSTRSAAGSRTVSHGSSSAFEWLPTQGGGESSGGEEGSARLDAAEAGGGEDCRRQAGRVQGFESLGGCTRTC